MKEDNASIKKVIDELANDKKVNLDKLQSKLQDILDIIEKEEESS